MRKNDRDGIVELITSIKEAMDYCSSVDFYKASPLIEDCEAAISSILGLLKGQLTDSVRASYNTILGNLENTIQVFHKAKIFPVQDEIYDSTTRSLLILSKKLQKEEVQYEVVFLPYNATMWDSMESIWIVAKEDPRCIPYVIPIPYYDKNSDGLLGEMHYDGELFPKYVSITHYTQYDIEKRKPEIIYIHNPYDRFNKVTSVHPMYYSSNLKKYTNMLVYVPYFIVMNYLEEDFAIMPGVRFADKVIVQSEQIAEEYKKYYPFEDKDKFLPLGSPKIDKVLQMNNLSRDELNLPKEWKSKIGNKKVILYNTHLDNIMNRGELLIRKLRYVFSCFENRDDVVLLWRPHPLSDSTAAAMNPDILESLKQIELEYKEKGIGIYDDTPDLHRSLALADVYYGDGSSLVAMFEVIKKPVMLQDVNLDRAPTIEEEQGVSFEDAYINDEGIWFSSNTNNSLYYKCKKSGKVTCIGKFPEDNELEIRLYSKVYQYKDKLIFIPFNADAIAEYSLSKNLFSHVYIKNNDIKAKFYTYIVYKEYLYLFPCLYDNIIKYNMETGSVEYMNNWINTINNYIVKNDYFKFINVRMARDKIYAPFFQANILFIFNLNSGNMQVETIEGDKADAYSGIEINGNDIFLISSKEYKINDWNEKTKKSNFLFYSDEECVSDLFIDSCVRNNELFILNTLDGSIQKIYVEAKISEFVGRFDFEDTTSKIYSRNMLSYCNIKANNNELLLFPMGKSEVIRIDENDAVDKEKFEITDESQPRYIIGNQMRNEFGYYIESINCPLPLFLDRTEEIIELQEDVKKKTDVKQETGKIIHNSVMGNF